MVRIGVGFLERFRQHLCFVIRGLERNAWFEPSFDRESSPLSIRQQIFIGSAQPRSHHHRNEKGRTKRLQEYERFGRNANDVEIQTIQPDLLSEDGWARPEFAVPELVTQNDHGIPPGNPILFRCETPAKLRFDSEDIEKISAH